MTGQQPTEVTQLLLRLQDNRAGGEAAEALYQAIYGELRRLATRLMRSERAGHTLQPTALLHEAYLKLVDQQHVQWQNRAHFVSVAVRAMRQILIDYARKRSAAKRGGDQQRVELDEALGMGSKFESDVLVVDELLDRLAELDPRAARVVELRVFGGLGIKEIAHVLEVSARTVDNDWAMAKAWLGRELSEGNG